MIKYPYTDYHELNLNWILEQVKNLENLPSEVEETLDEKVNEVNEQIEQVNELIASIPAAKFRFAANGSNVDFRSTDNNAFAFIILAGRITGSYAISFVRRFEGYATSGTELASNAFNGVTYPEYLNDTNTWHMRMNQANLFMIVPIVGGFDFV